jgi:hypothetical protein
MCLKLRLPDPRTPCSACFCDHAPLHHCHKCGDADPCRFPSTHTTGADHAKPPGRKEIGIVSAAQGNGAQSSRVFPWEPLGPGASACHIPSHVKRGSSRSRRGTASNSFMRPMGVSPGGHHVRAAPARSAPGGWVFPKWGPSRVLGSG